MANTRGIPHIGSRRFKRFFGMRRKPRFPWVFGTFKDTSLSALDGSLERLALTKWVDFDDPDTVALNQPLRVHRVQFQGGLLIAPSASAPVAGTVAFMWAVWNEDTDETDSELWGTSDNLMAQKQILKWGVAIRQRSAATAGVTLDVFHPGTVIPIRFDLRFRKPQRVMPDSQLVLGIQALSNVSEQLDSIRLTGVVRVVAQRQGTGR